MGVPKFFRYISERYPCLSEVVKEYQFPEFDNLYLDMNGIIHVCSHPNDTDPHFRITEEKIFRDIFHYIETLFRMIQPQKLFFMAVDGVAPRAKMNQQRGRRFRSAKDAEMAEERAQQRGEMLPSEDRFDSNCITPGTDFMTRLQAQLEYFVTFKISTDTLWHKVKVILSGHKTPGEGEHKIMDYIRYMKSRPEYDPNTRHCLYGLDADLIMLGLCTHEPHFSLLREEVKYVKSKGQKRIPTPEETTFFLLHLSLMREYLDLEFQQLKTTIPNEYDLEHIIDDWVLMGFLVGNDFIPHLPELHINKGALPILYRTYMEVRPNLNGYINEGGTLHLDRFQKYMERLAAFDLEQFKEYSADLRYLESKMDHKLDGKERHSYKDGKEPSEQPKSKDLAALIAATEEMLDCSEDDDDENYIDIDSEEEEDEDITCFAEFSAHKKNYYMEKMEYEKVTPEVLRDQCKGYVRAIQWNLNYYYNGCCSWSWFYPHHYAPYISDIKDFSNLKLEYELGKPFLPFQQLLAVLPTASKKLLPTAYHDLMEGLDSPILNFYPTEFKTDLNGKKQDWEAVVLIPFIDQESLLNAMATKEHELTEEEKQRNEHGPMQIFTYTPQNQGMYPAPAYFPILANTHAKCEEVLREKILVHPSDLVKWLCPGVKLEVYYSGFPTLKHIPFTAALDKAKVKVFESNSLGDNMILTILPQGHPDIREVANMLGKSIYVNWPHMYEARVTAVANSKVKFILKPENDSIEQQEMSKTLQDQWELTRKAIEEKYMNRMGIYVGKTEIVVYACSLEDQKYVLVGDRMQCEKQWAKFPIAYAFQTTRTQIPVFESEPDIAMTMDRLFPPGKIVFTLDQLHYGAMGKVVEIVKNKRVKVCVTVETEPNIEVVQQKSRELAPQYNSGSAVANRAGMTSHLLSRITGTIYIITGDTKETQDTRQRRLNIGLNLKFNKRNEEVCGYTRRTNAGYWLYSTRAEKEVMDYHTRFPEVFNYLNEKGGSEDIRDSDLYPMDTAEKLKELSEWLKEQESNNVERQKCGAITLSEEVVKALEDVIDKHIEKETDNEKTAVLYCIPSNLYVPKPKLGQAPDSKMVKFMLFDRVVNVRESHTVPLGYKGTIIGIHQSDSTAVAGQQTMYDILFDKEFTGGLRIRCGQNRGYRMMGQALINLSHGLRSDTGRAPGKLTAVVEPNIGIEDEVHSSNNYGHNSAFVNWRNPTPQNLEGSPPRHYQQQFGGESRRQGQQFSWAMDNTRHQPPHHQPYHQSAPHQLSNEYFAMFKQLQKSVPTPKGPMPNRSVAVDSGSESARALKNLLKIKTPDSSPRQQPPTMPLNSHSPKKPLLKNPSFCIQLLDFHQKRGIKLPIYRYESIPPNRVVCTVFCNNGQEFQGDACSSNDEAAESAARTAVEHLGLGVDKHPRGSGPFHTPNNPPLGLIPHRPTMAMPQRMDSGWSERRDPLPPPPPINWFPRNNFKPEWMRNNNGVPHSDFYSSPQQMPRYQPGQPFPSRAGSYQQGGQWQQFIPPQAESRFHQLSLHTAPREHQSLPEQHPQRLSQPIQPSNNQVRQTQQEPPASARQPPPTRPAPNEPPAARPPRRSRIAAKFSNLPP